ncbi:MAG: leucine-rich repeat protein, partial [Opitutales bacterium]|nr:leucine-rich repeat protein [Opitutales bacterium]
MPINAFLLLRKRSVLLSIISLLLFAAGAHADEWGDYTYRVDNGTSVTILGYLGTGGEISIPSEINGLPVTAINGSAFLNRVEITGSLVIPDGVTTIGWGAFSGCSGLNGTLTLPESLNTIGGHSFFNCTGLRGSVDVPAEVSYVGTYAFNGCVGLESIVFLGNAPSTFGTDVFTGTAAGFTLYCAADATGFTTPLWNGYPMLRWAPESDFVCETTWAGLWGITGYSGSAEHLVIPGIIGGKAVEMIAQTSLGSWDASTAPTFSSVDIPPSVKRIEQSAFRNCVNLAAVRLPEGLQILEGYAFYGCSGLTEVRLPSTLTEFYGNSFTGCSSLTSFEVAPGHPNAKSVNGLVLDQAGEALLLYPEGRTGIAVIPEGIKTIGGSVFYGCEGFTGFSLPSTLLEIGDYAFGCWSGVHELTIPDSVTTIGENAFSGSSFGSVTVGTGVLSLGHYAFESCSNLGWVRFMGNAPALGGDVFSDARSGFTVYYEAGATGFDGAEWVSQAVPLAQWNPAVDPNWLVEDDGSGVKLLGYSMPADNLVIPNTINGKTVVSIAASAFQFKTIFSGSVTIGSGVTSIEEGAFRGASNLTAILVDAENPSFASQSGLLYNKA